MTHFRTLIHLRRPYTDSSITFDFRSLMSIEFLTFDLMSKLKGWELHAVGYFAQFEGKRYSWFGAGAPRDFTGDWSFMYNTTRELAGDKL